MKLDFNLIKAILEDIEEKDTKDHIVDAEELKGGFTQEQVEYHLDIIEDDNLILITARIKQHRFISRLTAEGHRVLEAMRNDTIWNKIKDGTLGVGKEALKQAPAIFIQMALAGIK